MVYYIIKISWFSLVFLYNSTYYLLVLYLIYYTSFIMDFDTSKNYYQILWVSESASQDEIKKTFRKLAMKYHPDKAGWDKSKFQEVNEAHWVLSDEKKIAIWYVS